VTEEPEKEIIRTFTHRQLIDFLNNIDSEYTKKNPHMTKSEFLSFAWTKWRFVRFLFYDDSIPQHMDNAELIVLKQLHLQGFSLREIGFVLDRSLGSIEQRVHSFGPREQLMKELQEGL